MCFRDNHENETFVKLPQIWKKASQLCPYRYYNHCQKECTCESGQVNRYLNKVSGPLLDRIDLQELFKQNGTKGSRVFIPMHK